MLYAHNQEVYKNLCNALETQNKVMVLACTGHGKTYIVKELLENTMADALVLCTGKEIKNNWESLASNVTAITYHGFSRMTNPPEYPVVVIDEAHHSGSPVWGKKIKAYMDQHPSTKFIGLTADAHRYSDGGRDMTEELFGGNAVYGLTLSEAISQNVLPSFKYVCAWIQVEAALKDIQQKKASRGVQSAVLDKLISRLQYTAENTSNITRILKENMPAGKRKGILFVDSIDSIKEGVELAKANFSSPVWAIHSKQSDILNQDNRKAFDNAEEGWLVTVNKVNEGLHLNSVNTIIMLRRTQSPTVFFQQLGRAMSTDNLGQNVVVFDFVGNHKTLKTIAVESGKFFGFGEERQEAGNKFPQVIIDSYTQEALALLERIEDSLQCFWSPQDEKYLIENYAKHGVKECAKFLGRTEQAVMNKAHQLGLRAPIGWTPKEIKYLIENYPKYGAKECAKFLGRSKVAVKAKARALGLKASNEWTPEEVKYLVENYAKYGVKECVEFLGRTESAVKAKARALGLRASNEWTLREKKYLIENYAKYGVKECAKFLGRTENAVRDKAHQLGLGVSNEWTPKEIEYLIENYPKYGAEECAKFLGRTEEAVRKKAYMLGLGTTNEWTPEEIEYLVENYPKYGLKECAKFLGRTEEAVRKKAYMLGLKAPNKWTPKEKKYLIENYAKYGAKECAKFLGRTEEAVRKKAYMLRIKFQNRKGERK